jgi:Fe-Mn family superoxide dismutase
MEQQKLPDLPYDFDALEPVISAKIMELHYKKHHATYVKKLNEALEKQETAEKKNDLDTLIAVQKEIRFNGGGHINHSLFWPQLAPEGKGGGGEPTGELARAITEKYGSFDSMKEKLSKKATDIQGSGWGWLGLCPESKRLCIKCCENQDPLEPTQKLIPLLGIDVWEHAYYLQYENVRADYVKAIWRIINWKEVGKRFTEAKK